MDSSSQVKRPKAQPARLVTWLRDEAVDSVPVACQNQQKPQTSGGGRAARKPVRARKPQLIERAERPSKL
jgi:hypothetical protein